ncbi:MAG: hypothetical protein IID05_09745 [Gemmatimonadetes bacterium]|nr:hypothetical protein [Gemmatimonadota bacterium]
MPVTAKLSKSFYDALGENVANELVDWFNQVDATYRADLRELNDLNFQRFDAKMGERFAEFETKMERRFAGMEAKMDLRFADMDQRFVGMEAKMDLRFADMDQRFVGMEAKMDLRFADMDQQFAGMEAKMDQRFADTETKTDLRFTGTDAKMATGFASVRDELLERLVSQQQLADFRAEVSDKLGDFMKWTVVLWTTTILAVIATGMFG